MKKQTVHILMMFLVTALLLVPIAQAAAIIDATFGTNGSLNINIGTSQDITDFDVRSDGKILLVGNVTSKNADTDIFLARYNADGSSDNSFGNNGVVIITLSNRDESISNFEFQPDGKIVAVGRQQVFENVAIYDFLAVRFNENGSLDASFGENGIVTANHEQSDQFTSLTIQGDGKIVTVGGTREGPRSFAAVARFNADGTLDDGFRGDGLFIKELSSPANSNRFESHPTDVEVLADGRILTGGNLEIPLPDRNDQVGFYELIFTSDGSDDEVPFNPRTRTFASYGYTDESYNIEITDSGKVITVSGIGVSIGDKRFLQDGLDLVILPNGNIAVAGARFGGNLKIYSENAFIGGGWNVPTGKLAATSDNKVLILSEDTITKVDSVTSQGTKQTSFNKGYEFCVADIVIDQKADFAVYRRSEKKTFIRSVNGGVFERTSTFDATKVFPEFTASFLFSTAYRRNLVSFAGENSSGNQTFFNTERFSDDTFTPRRAWGLVGDIAVGGDFEGVGELDAGVFRPSNGVWYILGGETIQWGANGDKPVPADYDFDGKTDYAVYRPSTGIWWIRQSSNSEILAVQFGIETDIPLTGDYDADGKADFTVYRPSEGNWYQYLTTEGFRVIRFGIETDYPVPGDYDGDGRFDIAVYREGLWYLLQSTEGFKVVQFGTADDVPISIRYDE